MIATHKNTTDTDQFRRHEDQGNDNNTCAAIQTDQTLYITEYRETQMG